MQREKATVKQQDEMIWKAIWRAIWKSDSYKTKQAIIFEKLKPKFSKLPFLQSKTQFLKNIDTEQAILLE